MTTTEKADFIARASEVWDSLSERQKGRLEGQLDVYEKMAMSNKNRLHIQDIKS